MSNPNNPNFSYDIYGGIDAAVDAAYAQNEANAASRPVDALGQSTVVVEALNSDWTTNVDPGFLDIVTTSMECSRELCGRANMTTPSLEEFTSADVDFEKLARAHETMTELNLKPELVIAPVLSPDAWRAVYRSLTNDIEVNADEILSNGGLYIDDSIAQKWDMLNENPLTVTLGDMGWQVMLISGDEDPAICNVDQNIQDSTGERPDIFGSYVKQLQINTNELTFTDCHPTAHAYLTLQGNRLLRGEIPVDKMAWTWLSGGVFDVGGEQCVLFADYNSGSRHIGIDYCPINEDSTDGYGARISVWG